MSSNTGAAAGDAVARYVREQCESIVSADGSLRQDIFLVHDTRVAIRRLRSVLRVFPRLFESVEATGLDEELSWYAGLLGAVRDRDVQRSRVAEAVASQPPELVLGPIGAHLDDQLRSELSFHCAALVRGMDGERYAALIERLSALAERPPYPEVVDSEQLVRQAARASRKADRRLAAALASGDLTALHGARKAAKRARYSAEVVEPLGGPGISGRIKRLKAIQAALGVVQDSAATADLLRHEGAGTLPGQNGFTYGLLYARELRIAEAACALVATL